MLLFCVMTESEMAAHLGTCLCKERITMGERNVPRVHHIPLFSGKMDKGEWVSKAPA